MAHNRVAILGTGLIGASVGLGLKVARPQVQVVGYDASGDNLRRAQAVKAIREAITHHLTHPGNPQLPASDIQPAKPPRVCPHCYEPIPASRGPLAVYCSGRCGKAAQRARKGAQAARLPGVV